uniref:MyoD family inhibitor n=1 Tax=Anolis carolinensis TaxID=28377 RepID=G1KAZ3_ANOCA|nr:PREDICTED: myoD family inhibitor isoform X1 [Anolis carolinensis]|eukprot:XP_008107898.1 PREDICTED: myoD family inhibitor isoform X1 [Anolis carolinensis]
MSQVRRNQPQSPAVHSPHGEPPGGGGGGGGGDPAPRATGQDTNVSPSSMSNSVISTTTPDSSNPPHSCQNPTTGAKEDAPSQEHSAPHRSMVNGMSSSKTKSEDGFVTATEAVTRQPQGRVTVRSPPASTYVPLLQNGAGPVSDELGSSNGEAGNGALCSELRSLSGSQKPHRKLQSHHSINSQISKKSKGSSKSASSQIPTEAQEDCCVHCILSCLFCEFLTLCNIMLDCATCGSCSSEDSCICCCCCGSGECADCDLPCDMDCGIIDACCESADCLEICMECCGLCFSS